MSAALTILGPVALSYLKDTFIGKDATPNDIYELLDQINNKTLMAPSNTSKLLNEQQIHLTLSRLRLNIELFSRSFHSTEVSREARQACNHIRSYLKATEPKSYIDLVNKLCINMLGTDIMELMTNRTTPQKVTFNSRISHVHNYSDSLLTARKFEPMHDYVLKMRNMYSIYAENILSINAMTIVAMQTFADCPEDHELRGKCDETLSSENLKRFFPRTEKNKFEDHLTEIICPGTDFVLQDILGEHLIKVYNHSTGRTNEVGYFYMESKRFKKSSVSKRYMGDPAPRKQNPYLCEKKHAQKFYLSPATKEKDGYVVIRMGKKHFLSHSQDNGKLVGFKFRNGVAAHFKWHVKKIGEEIHHIFRVKKEEFFDEPFRCVSTCQFMNWKFKYEYWMEPGSKNSKAHWLLHENI